MTLPHIKLLKPTPESANVLPLAFILRWTVCRCSHSCHCLWGGDKRGLKKKTKHALLASEATISAATSIIQHGKKEVQRLKCTCLIKEAKRSQDSGRPQVLSRAVLHSSAFTAQRRRDCNSRTRIHSFFSPLLPSLFLSLPLSPPTSTARPLSTHCGPAGRHRGSVAEITTILGPFQGYWFQALGIPQNTEAEDALV